MFVSSPAPHIWSLIPNVMVLGGGAFGLGLESEALMNGISALIRDTLNSLLALSIISVYSKQMAIYV